MSFNQFYKNEVSEVSEASEMSVVSEVSEMSVRKCGECGGGHAAVLPLGVDALGAKNSSVAASWCSSPVVAGHMDMSHASHGWSSCTQLTRTHRHADTQTDSHAGTETTHTQTHLGESAHDKPCQLCGSVMSAGQIQEA